MSTDTDQDTLPLVERHVVEVPLLPPLPRPTFALPPYTGDKACVKCGKDDPSTSYHDGLNTYGPCGALRSILIGDGLDPRLIGEHMDRNCRNCQYGWVEAIKDPGR